MELFLLFMPLIALLAPAAISLMLGGTSRRSSNPKREPKHSQRVSWSTREASLKDADKKEV